MPSAGAKLKAFPILWVSIWVAVSYSMGQVLGFISSILTGSSRKTAVASVMYIVVSQMMNPFIYSLRNRDMKGALRNSSVGHLLSVVVPSTLDLCL